MKTYDLTESLAYIQDCCAKATDTDPVALALAIMERPEVRIHGPEHHYLTSAVLGAAYRNRVGVLPADALEKLKARCVKIPPAVCGYYGVCGCAMAAGAFVSLLLDATYLSREEWRITGAITARAQTAIAESSGPRCCKRTTITALFAAVDAINDLQEVRLDKPDSYTCTFGEKNNECLGKQCLYHRSHQS